MTKTTNPLSVTKRLYRLVRTFAEIDLKDRYVSIHIDQTLTDSQKRVLRLMRKRGFLIQLRFIK
ncbi:MAG: hypothetical protein AAF705_05375 [Bacteroidota bacterium]